MNKSYRGTNFEMKWWVEVAFVYYEDRLDAKLENLQWRNGHTGMTLRRSELEILQIDYEGKRLRTY